MKASRARRKSGSGKGVGSGVDETGGTGVAIGAGAATRTGVEATVGIAAGAEVAVGIAAEPGAAGTVGMAAGAGAAGAVGVAAGAGAAGAVGMAAGAGAASGTGATGAVDVDVLGVGSAMASGALSLFPQPLANTTTEATKTAVARRAMKPLRPIPFKWLRRTIRGLRGNRCSRLPRPLTSILPGRQLGPPVRAARLLRRPPMLSPFPAPAR